MKSGTMTMIIGTMGLIAGSGLPVIDQKMTNNNSTLNSRHKVKRTKAKK